jgi:MOSC domain-containing protein YiiM|tara:strand:- start:616 stop:1056 length:441 start_codon:yes stop_codon:yes gene_type:complete
MSKVIGIAISENPKGAIRSVNSVKAIAGKGLVNEYHFKNDNDKRCQITLIEIENINYYNHKHGVSIPSISFRRNIITEGIRLNELEGSEFLIGKVKVKAHDLCRPCKYLQESLKQKNIIREFLQKGGLRCEILTDGEIFVDDKIKC